MQSTQAGQHNARIVEQFSKQAIPFARMPAHADGMQTLFELAQLGAEDTVLDVACGPGLVACEAARKAAQVTGMDVTAAMLELARRRQLDLGLTNMTWIEGSATALPFPDAAFSVVLTRYSFHHFLSPEAALKEMIRVCRPGGCVLVADVAIEPEKSAAYDRLEILRDPSHVHALTVPEFHALIENSGLAECRQSSYAIDLDLEAQLRASFPNPGDDERIRDWVTRDIGVNEIGIQARRENGVVRYSVPIGVYAGIKRAGGN